MSTEPESTSALSNSVGVLHPGVMGAALGAELARRGFRPLWVSGGRGEATRARAEAAGFTALPDMATLCRACSLLISIAPPHAAEAIAHEVAGEGYTGLFLEANAISPDRSAGIRATIEAAGARYVDGAIIGQPELERGETRLLLSGPAAGVVADCFRGGHLLVDVLEERGEKASALKMCDSAMRKGELAMLCATVAAAQHYGIGDDLERVWRASPRMAGHLITMEQSGPRLAKAWRFAGEMEEVADSFATAGLPEGFHRAAGETYRRLVPAGSGSGTRANPLTRLYRQKTRP